MRTVPIALAIAAILLVPGAGMSEQGDSPALGIISQIHGAVFLEHGGTKTVARLADLLYSGDRLSTAAGQAAFLFCPSSSMFTLSGEATVELGSNDVRILKGQAPQKTPAKCLLPRIALGAESMERLGGLRARNEIPIALYLGGTITSERPVFRWEAVAGAESYRFTLKDANQDNTIWQNTTSSTSLAYPESMPPLGKIPYEWEVLALAGVKTLARGNAGFEVKPNPALSQAPGAPAGQKLLHAIELENEGYFAEAAACYRDIRGANPEDTRLTRHLGWLYWNAGLIVAANDELRRLAEKPQK